MHKNPIGSDKREKNSPTQSRPAQHTLGCRAYSPPSHWSATNRDKEVSQYHYQYGVPPVSMCWDAVLSGFFGLPKGYATDEYPGDKVNATKLRSRLLPSVPKVDLAPILWPRRGCLCRNNASKVSSCLHMCGRIKQTAATKCRANHAYASSLFSAVAFRAICQQGAIRAPLVPASSVDRHLYVLGVKQLDAANALQPYTAVDDQLLTWVRPPVSRDLRETVGSGATV